MGDPYVKVLTTLHFSSSTGYHIYEYPLYRLVEQSFIESITNLLVTKNGEDMLSEVNDIPSVVTLHIDRNFRRNRCQFTSYNGSIYTVLRKSNL